MSHNNKTLFRITAAPTVLSTIGAGLTENFLITALRRNISPGKALKEAVEEYVNNHSCIKSGMESAPQAPCEREGLADDSRHSQDTRAHAPAPAPSCL